MGKGRSAAKILGFQRSQARSGVVSAWLVGSALIALVLACLPIGTGPSSASVMAPGSTISNSALKGDRLPAQHTGRVAPKSETSKSSNIPVGCEAAFSKLVHFGNFTSRCVT
jgi:hypothetical protein